MLISMFVLFVFFVFEFLFFLFFLVYIFDCLVCVLFSFLLLFYRCLFTLLFSGFPGIYLSPNWFSGMEVNESILSRSQGARQRWRRRLEECSLWWRAIVSGWSSLAETSRSYYFCHRVCKIWFTCKGTIEFSKGIFNEYQLFSGLLTTSVATAVGKWRLSFLFSPEVLPSPPPNKCFFYFLCLQRASCVAFAQITWWLYWCSSKPLRKSTWKHSALHQIWPVCSF